MRYRAYGLVLESEVSLPELEAAPTPQPADLSLVARADPAGEGWHWVQPPLADDEAPWIAIGARGDQHRVLFDTGAEFVIDAPRRQVQILSGAAPDAAVRHRLIDQVVPLALAHLGRMVLHASAVVTPSGHAVAFAGPSGAGKSTLSAAFARMGATVLSDDALVVERCGDSLQAASAYPGVRVRPDMLPVIGAPPGPSSDGKRRASAADGVPFRRAPARLECVYVLGEEIVSTITIERIAPRETIMALVEYAFVLDVSDKQRVAAHFARVAEWSACVDVRSLAYPRTLASLPAVCAAVDEDLKRR